MYSRSTLLVLQAFLVMSMAAFNPRSSEAAGLLIRKAHVSVANDLNSGLDLTVHCLSADDDLGIKVLPHGGNFTFVFRPNFQGTTLFHCSFDWAGLEESRYFDIFDGPRDSLMCGCNDFNWNIREDGPVMFDPETGKFDFFYTWKGFIFH